jgi:hypothetical protein
LSFDLSLRLALKAPTIKSSKPSPLTVSTAGDVNGDGLDDLIVGAYKADPNSRTDAGSEVPLQSFVCSPLMTKPPVPIADRLIATLLILPKMT